MRCWRCSTTMSPAAFRSRSVYSNSISGYHVSTDMDTVIATSASPRITVITGSKPQAIPWYLWGCLTAGFCIAFGLYWDISWHESIGRDTFWTPAHLLIQFGAVLAGIYSSFLIFGTTFGKNQAAQDASVNVLGFRGPFGAFVCAWGGAAMLASAPFA